MLRCAAQLEKHDIGNYHRELLVADPIEQAPRPDLELRFEVAALESIWDLFTGAPRPPLSPCFAEKNAP